MAKMKWLRGEVAQVNADDDSALKRMAVAVHASFLAKQRKEKNDKKTRGLRLGDALRNSSGSKELVAEFAAQLKECFAKVGRVMRTEQIATIMEDLGVPRDDKRSRKHFRKALNKVALLSDGVWTLR